MWNISDSYREQLLDEVDNHLDTIHMAREHNAVFIDIIKELGFDYDNLKSLKKSEVIARIKELKAK